MTESYRIRSPGNRGEWVRVFSLIAAVDQIPKGAKPAEPPVQQSMKFELVINLKAAKQIVVTIPQWVLMRADKVIK